LTIYPIDFSDEVNKQFLNFQLSAYPLSDPYMADQAKKMLEGADPDLNLMKGPPNPSKEKRTSLRGEGPNQIQIPLTQIKIMAVLNTHHTYRKNLPKY
jgi:hypothetical protein